MIQDKKRHETLREFKEATQVSLRAQLEPEHEIPDIRQSQLQLIHEKTRIVTKRFTHDN